MSKTIFFLSIIITSCIGEKKTLPHFSATSDTLILQTRTHKGAGDFQRMFAPLNFRDTSEQFSYPITYPANLTNIKRASKIVDHKVAWYRQFKESENTALPAFLLKAILNKDLDTLNLPTQEQNQIDIVRGQLNDEIVFAIDQNNNQDLSDDSIRKVRAMNWHSDGNEIESLFYQFSKESVIQDTTWVKVGTLGAPNLLFVGVAEYLTADFFLDNEHYQIGIADYQADFPYHRPNFALLSNGGNTKDTLLLKDILYPDEFIELSGAYYRFSSVSNDGAFLTLVREDNFDNKFGTQVGIKAPEFTCISTYGDTIKSSNLHDKILIIANSCGCGGDKKTIIAFNEIKNRYSDKAYILHLDTNFPKMDEDEKGIHIDFDEEFNSEIYNKIRQTYCSRICYVVDKNNIVIDKFLITHWKDNLPKYFTF